MKNHRNDFFKPDTDPEGLAFYEKWRHEYLTELTLTDLLSEEDSEEKTSCSETIAQKFKEFSQPYSGELEIGEIRLLSHSFVYNSEHLPYFVVLENWEKDFWLIAPFSRFSVPATSGEMLSTLTYTPIQVIQVWNARTAPEAFLKKSWSLNEKLPENVLQEARQLFRHLLTGKDLPADFQAKRGPIVDNLLDLRQQYLAEEKQQFQPLSNLALWLEELRSKSFELIWKNFAKSMMLGRMISQLTYAAASEETEQRKTYKIEELNIYCSFTKDKMAKKILISFYDSNNKASYAADKYEFFDENAQLLAVVDEDFAELPYSLKNKKLSLVSKNGDIVTLTEQKE